jgi:hypothetical protein
MLFGLKGSGLGIHISVATAAVLAKHSRIAASCSAISLECNGNSAQRKDISV